VREFNLAKSLSLKCKFSPPHPDNIYGTHIRAFVIAYSSIRDVENDASIEPVITIDIVREDEYNGKRRNRKGYN